MNVGGTLLIKNPAACQDFPRTNFEPRMDTNTHEWLCHVKALKQISPIRRFSDAPLRLVLMLPAHLPRRSLREGSCSCSCSKISDPRNTPNDTKEETTELIIKDETDAIVFASEILASLRVFRGQMV